MNVCIYTNISIHMKKCIHIKILRVIFQKHTHKPTIHFSYFVFVREAPDNFTNRLMHFLVSSTKQLIHKFQFHTTHSD